jgi:hypothetical protein
VQLVEILDNIGNSRAFLSGRWVLAKVGKDVIEGEVTLGFEDSLAGMTS